MPRYFFTCAVYVAVLVGAALFACTVIDPGIKEISNITSLEDTHSHYDPLIQKAQSAVDAAASGDRSVPGYLDDYVAKKEELRRLEDQLSMQVTDQPPELKKAQTKLITTCLVCGGVLFVVFWFVCALSNGPDHRLEHKARSYSGSVHGNDLTFTPTGEFFGLAGILFLIAVVILHPLLSIGPYIVWGTAVLLGAAVVYRGYTAFDGSVPRQQAQRKQKNARAYRDMDDLDDLISVSDGDDE